MYIDKLIKKQVITLVVSVLILLTIFIGVSLASFLSVDEGASNTISMGDLKISFCSDTSCNSTYTNYGKVIGTTTQDGTTVPVSIYPYATQSEALTNTPYIFNIENTGTLKAKLNIKLIEDADFLPTGDYASYTALTTLYANHLKIGIKQCSDTNVFEYGDINMDGLITNDDNTLINNHIAGTSLLTGKALELADVNQDGSVSSADATLVSNFISSGVYNVLTTSTYGELTNNSILSDESLDPGSDNTYCLWTWLDETTPNGVQSTYFVANLEFEAEYKPITPTCKDKEGVDCASMSGLCGDMAYYATMTKNCPATCNRCGCEDVSDSCSNMSSLCGSALYYKILKQKCPVTCGYCE